MGRENVSKEDRFQINPVGSINQNGEGFEIEIFEPYRAGLKELENFSHVMVFWWADAHDNADKRKVVEVELPYAKETTAGVFACRSEYRPNPVAVTISSVLGVDEKTGKLRIDYSDAMDKTPVIDLKPYIPVCDRIKNVNVAPWFKEWPEWYEEAGEFFSNYSFE